jgi:O-antigen ligase
METAWIFISILLVWTVPHRWAIALIVFSTFNNTFVGSFDLATILIIFCFLRTFVHSLPNALKSNFVRAYGIFMIWSIVSVMWATDVEASQAAILTTIRIFMGIVITHYVVNEDQDLYPVIVACLMGILYSLFGALEVIPGIQRVDAVERLSVGVASTNTFAVQLIFAGALVYYYIKQRVRNDLLLQIIVAIVFVGVMWSLIASSGSRAGLLALLSVALILSLEFTPIRLATLVLFIAGLAFSGAFVSISTHISSLPFVSADLRQRLQYTLEGQDDTYRQYIWQTGLLMASENAIGGVGVGNSVTLYRNYAGRVWLDPYAPRPRTLHNTYITVFAELGIVGLILFLRIFWYWSRPINRNHMPTLTLFASNAILLIIVGFFHSFEQVTLIMVLLTVTHKVFIMSAKEGSTPTLP